MYTHTKKGMTFVEMIVVVSLYTILMLAVSNSIASFYKVNAYTIAQSYQVYNARIGVQQLTQDVREMTFADDGTFPLARMEDHIIGFYSDIDRDDSVEYVEYELATSTVLTKRIYNANATSPIYDTSLPDETHILSEYVQNLIQGTSTFSYFDTNGVLATATSSVTDIRYVQMKSIVNIDPVREPGQFMLRSSAALRNVIDNI
ncbi:MAG: prepilin-type N-terminal cleavage/methylation domain-containing protein [Acidimicrobiales bacterium]|jgi:prepilin-type N-terminal cleavage/methylation domain-containing protein